MFIFIGYLGHLSPFALVDESHTKDDVKQMEQTKKIPINSIKCMHANSQAEFPENLHPGKHFPKATALVTKKICLCVDKAIIWCTEMILPRPPTTTEPFCFVTPNNSLTVLPQKHENIQYLWGSNVYDWALACLEAKSQRMLYCPISRYTEIL